MRPLAVLLCLLCAGIPFAVVAEAQASTTAVHAISDNEIALGDGRTLHLEGIAAPFADDEKNRHQAQKELEDLIASHSLVFDGAATDRYGRLDAQTYAVGADGKKIWLQGEMLRRGLAFVYPPVGTKAQFDDMRKIESSARHDQVGIWADQAYADIPAEKLYAKEGRFVFISGIVYNAVRAKNTVYLDFGPDWHKSFSVEIAAHDLHNFRNASIDPLDLKGKTIRVRGWLRREPKPMMVVTSPEQIDLLTRP